MVCLASFLEPFNEMNQTIESQWGKVPEVTLWFWVIKIAATTLGETGGDAVTMSMNLGYAVGTAIFVLLFLVAVAAQIAVRRYHPFLFWGVIVATTTAGTTLADLVDRSFGIGYAGGAIILLLALLGTLFWWHRSCGSVNISEIATRKAEMFYWATIMFSQTLGTALGDWMADDDGGLDTEAAHSFSARAWQSSQPPVSASASRVCFCSGRLSS